MSSSRMPASVAGVLVVGVGDPQAGMFIDGHQSRQDVSTLRQIAARLRGVGQVTENDWLVRFAGDDAQLTDFGEEDSHDLFDLLNSKTIVLWGKNPYVSNVHLLPVLRTCRERGVRLVQIDPVHHRGSELCDFSLQPRPGGDIALLNAGIEGQVAPLEDYEALDEATDAIPGYEKAIADCLAAQSD